MSPRSGSGTPSTDRDLWQTPPPARAIVLRILGSQFMDPVPDKDRGQQWAPFNGPHLLPETIGLTLTWPRTSTADYLPAFLNPPYSELDRWCGRAVVHAQHAPVLALLPSRTDTKWFDVHAGSALRIWFPRKRIRFLRPDGGVGTSPPFGSAWILWGRRPRDHETFRRFDVAVRDLGGVPLKVVGR